MASSDDRAATQVSADPVSAPESVADAPGIKVAPADASPRTHRRLLGALPAVAAVLSTLWVFRAAIFQGRLPGNIGDSRWTIALHEHWYRVWQGQEAIRDLDYYYPVHNTLGTSDAFLVQGQLYSIARMFGLGLVDSWLLAQVLFFLLGAIGVAILSTRLLESLWLQVAFVVLTCTSYPVLVQGDHVQLIGFLSCSWILVGFHDLVTRRHITTGLALIAIVPPVLAMSSWYAFVLLAMVLAFLAAFFVVVSSGRGITDQIRRTGTDVLRQLKSPVGIVLLVCFLAGWAFVLWIYLPSRSLLPAPNWTDVVAYSPRWSDLVNSYGGGGGWWSWLYAGRFDPASFNPEQAQGFTPVLLLVFLLFGLLQIRSALLGRPQSLVDANRAGRSGLVAVWFTVIAVALFFVIDERGWSVYRFFWFHVPGLESIRTPFRVQALLFSMAIFLVLRSLELRRRRPDQSPTAPGWRKVLLPAASVLLVLALFVEMQRPPTADWTRAGLLQPELQAMAEEIQQSCDAMILADEDPSDPVWVNPIDAVILSALSGVPTPQGYSRADPIGHPGPLADGASLANWMRTQGFDGRICLVSAGSVRELSTS